MSDRDSHRDDILRRTLWVSVFFNLGGGLAFAFPSSPFGRLVGLPTPVPAVYSVGLALFVLLFGGTYAWLALQSRIDRPLVALAAIGKASFFGLMVVLWLAGEASDRVVLGAAGDLILAAIFTWWLLGGARGRA